MEWIISDIDNLPVILCGLFYALLCVFSIVTGLIYIVGERKLNPVELPDKFVNKMNEEELRQFSCKMGFVTAFVGLVQGLAAFCLFKGGSLVLYWIALGFTIFSIASVLFKLKGKISLFPIVKLVFYVLILIILLLSSTKSLFFPAIIDDEVDNELVGYKIVYSNNRKQYTIEPKESNIKVTVSEIIVCIQAPCDPIEKDNFKVKYTNEYRKVLKSIIKENKSKEIFIYSDDLDDEELFVIMDIVGEEEEPVETPPNVPDDEIEYEIKKNAPYYDSRYGKEGYYVEKSENGKVLVTVAMGERNTGGYSISIVDVHQKGETVSIYVKMSSPPRDAMVTQALTYPTIQVELSRMPKEILVINDVTDEDFALIETS